MKSQIYLTNGKVELAAELEEQTLDMKRSLEALYQILSKLTQLLPESAFDIGLITFFPGLLAVRE